MNNIIFVNCDLIEVWDERNINEDIDPFTDTSFKFEDEVGAASYNARAFFLFPQNLYHLIGGCCVEIFVPHKI